MNEKKDAVVVQPEVSISPSKLLEMAIEKGVDTDQLEKLLDLQERWEKTNAEKAFNLAMAKFQKECPVIEKKKIVRNRAGEERYRFAPIGDIIRQVKKLLAKHKLFYDFTTTHKDGFLTAICTATHENGHSKQASFTIPIGKEDYMTEVQKYGARRTFAERYAFCDVFGIATADTDNDGIDGQQPASESQKNEKITKEKSSNLLIQTKIVIDEYSKPVELQASYKKHVNDVVKLGMHQSDTDQLKKYINAKNVSLKKASQQSKVKLP